jgi:hypothetical protein
VKCEVCGAGYRDRRRYPLAPLAAQIGAASHREFAKACGLSGSSLVLARCHGLGREQAEAYAIRANLHPYEVWPEMADHDAGMGRCLNCDKPFFPASGGGDRRRYCSDNCAHAHRRRVRYVKDPAYRERRKAEARAYYAENKRAVLLKHDRRRALR